MSKEKDFKEVHKSFPFIWESIEDQIKGSLDVLRAMDLLSYEESDNIYFEIHNKIGANIKNKEAGK